MHPNAEQISTALSRLLDLTRVLQFNAMNPQQLLAACLYARMVELALGVSSLLHAGVTSGIPVLVRALLEAFADFSGLLRDRDHAGALVAKYTSQKLQALEVALREEDPNPLMSLLARDSRIHTVLGEVRAQLEQLRAAGHHPLSAKATFEKAGLLHEYESMYWHLCLESHNNIAALEHHHIRVVEGRPEIRILQEPDLPRLSGPLDLALSTVVHAHERLRQFLGIPVDDEFRDVVRLFAEARAALPEDPRGGIAE